MADKARDIDELIQVQIDPTKKITGVQVKNQSWGDLHGLRLIDENGDFVFNETWYESGLFSKGAWGEVVDLPQDTSIIGYRCETNGNEIERLAFLLW